ncbi:MAG: helix-turn-helix domain-containing protein [Myxococcaceae bacterium]
MRMLEEFEAYVEKEARHGGPAALADFQAQRERFRLARQIAERRKASKLTQVQLSRRSGVPQSEISKIESGAVNASEVTLLRLLSPMGLTLGLVRATSLTAKKAPARRPLAPRSARGVVVAKSRTHHVPTRSAKD